MSRLIACLTGVGSFTGFVAARKLPPTIGNHAKVLGGNLVLNGAAIPIGCYLFPATQGYLLASTLASGFIMLHTIPFSAGMYGSFLVSHVVMTGGPKNFYRKMKQSECPSLQKAKTGLSKFLEKKWE